MIRIGHTCPVLIVIDTNQEENIARQFILSSEYKKLLTYPTHINYFLTTAHGNLEYGPNGLMT